MLASCGGQGGTIPTSSEPAVIVQPRRLAGASLMTLHSNPNNLQYGGGPIQSSPKVYVVFWGTIWNSTTGDPNGVKEVIKTFLFGLKKSQWTSTMTQYYGPVGTHIANTTALSGSFIDTANQPPLHPSDSQIAAEALVAAAHYNDYLINASYVVAMPHDHNPTAFGNQYCAYHNDESGTGGIIAYTNLPYMPDAGGNCGAGTANNPGTDDGVSIVEGHEQAETETDPQPISGWYGPLGEIGDACAWQNLQNTKFSSGTFPTQPLWSNSAGGCVQ